MSEPQVDAPPSDAPGTTTFLLDGDAPRLGGRTPTVPTSAAPSFEAPTMAPPVGPANPQGPSPLLSAPGSAPLLGSTEPSHLPTLPTTDSPVVPMPAADAPSLPSAVPPAPAPAPAARPSDDLFPAEPDVAPASTAVANAHPMAHLMPEKTAVSEASKRAAEIRAAKKAKARKIKIGAALVALVVAVLAGPPLASWVSDALNDAGSTTVDE